MVGTIEPRKGYGHALAAFESLWEKGEDVNLVIIGKAGWNVETLVSRLRNHPEAGSRLFWLDNATDEMLEALYGATAGLLMASEAEGFGLPIVEAAKYAKPIMLRDIPVFREIAKANAHYFSSGSHADLAAELMKWIELIRQNKAIVSTEIGEHSWEKSAKQLLFKLESLVSKSNRL